MGRVKRIFYLSSMRAAKVQASLRIRAVSPEPPLLAHTSSESRGTFRQKARSLAPLNGWACAVKICHDGMLEDTNSLDATHIIFLSVLQPRFLLSGKVIKLLLSVNIVHQTGFTGTQPRPQLLLSNGGENFQSCFRYKSLQNKAKTEMGMGT